MLQAGRPRARSHRARSAAAESNLPDSLLGLKVSIYYRLPQAGEFNEVVGIVQRDTEGDDRTLTIIKREGTLVEVKSSDIVKMKVVPTDRGNSKIPKTWSGYRAE